MSNLRSILSQAVDGLGKDDDFRERVSKVVLRGISSDDILTALEQPDIRARLVAAVGTQVKDFFDERADNDGDFLYEVENALGEELTKERIGALLRSEELRAVVSSSMVIPLGHVIDTLLNDGGLDEELEKALPLDDILLALFADVEFRARFSQKVSLVLLEEEEELLSSAIRAVIRDNERVGDVLVQIIERELDRQRAKVGVLVSSVLEDNNGLLEERVQELVARGLANHILRSEGVLLG